MPKFIDTIEPEAIEAGRARVIKLAEERQERPAQGAPSDAMKSIAESIKRLEDLQAAALKLTEQGQAPDKAAQVVGKALSVVMSRIVELSDLMRQTMETMSQQFADLVPRLSPPEVHFHPPENAQGWEFTVHRDGYGRITKVNAKRGTVE